MFRWQATLFILFVSLLQIATPSVATEKGAFLGAKPTEYPDWFKQSFLELEADVEEAADGGKKLVVLFHQDGCPYCNVLVERNLSQKDIETRLREHFDVIAINMWGDREVISLDGNVFTEKEFAAALKVQFTPSLIFLDEQGKKVLRLNGYLPPDRFRIALDYVAGGHYRKQRFAIFAAEQNRTSNKARNKLNNQPFFASGDIDLSTIPAERAIAVFFEQKDCPMCDALHDGPLRDEEVRDTAAGLHVVQLDMWSSQPLILPDGSKTTAREWAKTLDVKYAPTIVLMDSGGREIIRNEAEFKTFHTNGIFEYARSGDYRRQPNFQRWLEARADHLREQGLDVDLWK